MNPMLRRMLLSIAGGILAFPACVSAVDTAKFNILFIVSEIFKASDKPFYLQVLVMFSPGAQRDPGLISHIPIGTDWKLSWTDRESDGTRPRPTTSNPFIFSIKRYYRVAKFGPTATTRIGVRPSTPKVKKFVSIPSKTIPYNSRIPLVVYVPEGGEVRYRIWKASETTEKAKKG